MDVILCEKPSVARDIAKVLKVNGRHDGYIANDAYAITWAFGHLVGPVDPEGYDPALKKWSIDSLPIVPETFKLRAIGDDGAIKQLATIKELCSKATGIICATDAGREGELIFRYIMAYLGVSGKPVKRLWISSMTDTAIAKGFAELRDGSEFDKLAHAARCRSEADWLVGMNATRLYTLLFGLGNDLLSVGRVQTPVLAMLVARFFEINAFVPEEYYSLSTIYRETTFKYEKERVSTKADADALLAAVNGQLLTITDIQRKEQSYDPPLLLDLTTLQRVANIKYGFSADQTLKAAQELYEGKAITYPRTDSNYLSADMKSKVPGILEGLRVLRPEHIAALHLDKLPSPKRIYDDAKVSDHHAIIPTEVLPKRLSPDLQKIYDLIVDRFIAAFYPNCLKAHTTVSASVVGHRFIATGTEMLKLGWKEIIPEDKAEKEGDKEAEQKLPSFAIGESGPHKPKVAQKKTQPPRHYTEASLLAAMETAGKQLDDEELRQAMKEKGLGTPATRAGIIELLFKRQYAQRLQKKILPTEKGVRLITLIRDPRLKSPELTGDWEYKLKQIEKGNQDHAAFMSEITAFTRALIEENRYDVAATLQQQDLGKCPRCGKPVIKGKRDYGCSGYREGCTFVMPATYGGFDLRERHIREILSFGRLLLPLPTVDAKGKSYVAIDKDGNPCVIPIKEGAEKVSAKGADVCPACGGQIKEGPKAFVCQFFRQGCGFILYKSMSGKEMSREILAQLQQHKRTERMDGFTSKQGKPFSAALVIQTDGSLSWG